MPRRQVFSDDVEEEIMRFLERCSVTFDLYGKIATSDAFGTALRTRSGRGRLSWAVRRCSLKGGYHKGDLSLSRLHTLLLLDRIA